MKAFCLLKPFEVEVQERPVPKTGPDEALIRVQCVSLCGTDIHAYHGRQALFDYPRLIGHEICGIVEEVKEPSHSIAKGDKVAVIPYISCGKCISCRKGKPGSCETLTVTGVHREGGFAEYCTMPTDYLVKVGPDMDPVRAALIEPYAISAHAVHNVGVTKGDNVLVVGGGPIGLGAAEVARTYGANLIIADVDAARRAFAAEKFGYQHVLNPLDEDYAEQLKKLTNGDFPDIIIETTGNGKSMGGIFRYLSYGGKIVFVGIYNGDMAINDVEFHKRQTTLYGSRGATRFDFEYVVKCLQEGSIDTLTYLTDCIDFDDNIVANFKELMAKGPQVFKSVVKIAD